jgi:periplasmic divalent cation tolerance protein
LIDFSQKSRIMPSLHRFDFFMDASVDAIVVLTTCSSESDRDLLVRTLLAERLAACVQVSSIRSHYVWQGEYCEENEFQIFVKTKRALFEQVETRIKSLHSYETPEIIALPVVAGSAEYL